MASIYYGGRRSRRTSSDSRCRSARSRACSRRRRAFDGAAVVRDGAYRGRGIDFRVGCREEGSNVVSKSTKHLAGLLSLSASQQMMHGRSTHLSLKCLVWNKEQYASGRMRRIRNQIEKEATCIVSNKGSSPLHLYDVQSALHWLSRYGVGY